MRKLLLTSAAALAIATFGGSNGARADITIQALPQNQSFTGENILFNAGLITSGSTVQGLTQFTDTIFNFTSTTDNLSINQNGTGGAAQIVTNNSNATDQFINDLSIYIAPVQTFGSTFNAYNPLGFNIQSVSNTTGTLNFQVTAYDAQGNLENPTIYLSPTVFDLTAGQNKFLVSGSNGEVITNVRFISTADVVQGIAIDQVKQVSVTLTNIAVPEPASLVLFGTGLLGLGLLARRHSKNGAV